MDGLEAATQIRAQFDMPVIFLTDFADQPILERARQAEPYGYVLKPFKEHELAIAIEMADLQTRHGKKTAGERGTL